MRRAFLLLAVAACQSKAAPPPAPSGPPRFERAGDGDVAALVQTAEADAAKDHRRLLVYVGAVWCGPCQAFHAAVENGSLDAALPGVTMLEFDLDLDEQRLADAGYSSELVPLFDVPGPDGRATARMTSGAKSNSDYVKDLVPRITALFQAPAG